MLPILGSAWESSLVTVSNQVGGFQVEVQLMWDLHSVLMELL
jgi:hypothetical protein